MKTKNLQMQYVLPIMTQDNTVPTGEKVTLTRELIEQCRANGSFTNATLRAFGICKATFRRGWPERLIGKVMTREEYRVALEGKFVYNSGPLE